MFLQAYMCTESHQDDAGNDEVLIIFLKCALDHRYTDAFFLFVQTNVIQS